MSVISAPKVSLQIVVIVGGVIPRPALAGGIGSQFTGERQELYIDALGMNIAGQAQMLEDRNVPVEHLQHEIIDILHAAAGAGIGRIARQLFKFRLDPADHPVEPAGEHRKASRVESRRSEFRIVDDRLVTHLDNARQAKPDKARLAARIVEVGDKAIVYDAKFAPPALVTAAFPCSPAGSTG